jgi:hypothetical protein
VEVFVRRGPQSTGSLRLPACEMLLYLSVQRYLRARPDPSFSRYRLIQSCIVLGAFFEVRATCARETPSSRAGRMIVKRSKACAFCASVSAVSGENGSAITSHFLSEENQQHHLPLVYLINRVIAKKSTAYFPNLQVINA